MDIEFIVILCYNYCNHKTIVKMTDSLFKPLQLSLLRFLKI